MMMLLSDLDRFIKTAQDHNLGDLTVTLQTQTFGRGQDVEWVDTYKFTLPAKAFPKYLETTKASTEERLPMLERLWKVDFDRFKQFQYSK
jgi:hypothetical protein